MSPPANRLVLLMAGLLSMGLLVSSAGLKNSQQTVNTVDVVEGMWHQFDCVYNADIDNLKHMELGVTVKSCDSGDLVLCQKPNQLSQSVVAAILGKLSVTSMTGIFNGSQPPVFYSNPDHPMVRANLVEVSGDTSNVSIRIRGDASRTDGLCAVCAQIVDKFTYTMMKTELLRIRKPPTAQISFSGEAVVLPAEKGWEMRKGADGRITCTGDGEEKITLRLLKNDVLLEEVYARTLAYADLKLTYEIKNASRGSAGQYICQVVSDLPSLVKLGRHIGSDKIFLAVKFPPQFELSEIVRYTPVGSQEDIQITIFAYPEAQVTCNPSPARMDRLAPNSDMDFSVRYLLVLSNAHTDLNLNETQFLCSARNDVGEHTLSVRLTARAPRPEITSGRGTQWSNSYQLEWQHDAKAKVDYYQLEILYKGENSTTTLEQIQPKTAAGPTDPTNGSQGMRLESHVVYNLRPDTEHEIRLSSCNNHGCSGFSDAISVQTQEYSVNTHNDPANPVKAQVDNKPGSAATVHQASFAPLSAALIGLIFGRQLG